ncbi:zf-HC2 domain-containing protein [Mycolicibacterium chubuense]|nr:zf-HC2 domain-containing protein [Mycolicibacterium chubuense]
MNCEVAREALSARIDGEREPVPAARVDEHLANCPQCRTWLEQATMQSATLKRLAQPPTVLAAAPPRRAPAMRTSRRYWPRSALAGVGVAQIALGAAQAFGWSAGLSGGHGMTAGGHLFNESTAWSIALGVVMIGAALRPGAAAGLASVLSVFAGVLAVYVTADAISGAVTASRIVSHLPLVLGAVLAILVWRRGSKPAPAPSAAALEAEIVLPRNASRGRRRGHLWPTDDSAA